MSFILDALKKLEREKDEREPGVVLVGPVPWGERDPRRRGAGLAMAGAVLAVVLGGAFLWLRSGPEPRKTAPRGDEGTAGPAATGDQTTTVAPVPTGLGSSEISPASPSLPGTGTTRPDPARSAPPPPRARPRREDSTPPAARGAAPAAVDELTLAEATTSTRPPPPESVTAAEPAPEVAPAAPETLHEPTTPAAVAPEFRLTAISSRDGHPIALLNDRLVREGDRFGDITILEIGETSVEIEVKGKRQTVGF